MCGSRIFDAQHAYPGIAVHIDEGPDQEVLQWLHDRRVDLGFVVLPEEHFDTVALAEDQMVALLPAGHPLAGHASLRLDELCSDPFIMTEAGSGQIISRLFEVAKLQPAIRYRNAQVLSTLGMVTQGAGIAIVAELALPPGMEKGYVVKPLQPPVRRSIGIALPAARLASPAALAFLALAKKMAQQNQIS